MGLNLNARKRWRDLGVDGAVNNRKTTEDQSMAKDSKKAPAKSKPKAPKKYGK